MSASFVQTAFLTASFAGRNGAGSISVPGIKVGDAILVAAIGGTQPLTSQFIPIVTTDDEVEQLYAGDNTANTFTIFVMRSTAA